MAHAALTGAGVLVAGAVAAAAYARTAFGGIPGGDAGELVAEACQLGVAHPPGYPGFVWLARAAIELLPSRLSPARRVNMACAALGAATAVGVYAVVVAAAGLLGRQARRGGTGATPALAVTAVHAACAASFALLWALSPHVWLYSTGAEVFALNNAAVAALLVAGAVYARGVVKLADDAGAGAAPPTRQLEARLRGYATRLTCAGALLCGLALTNQHTSVLAILPLMAWVAASQVRLLTVRMVAAYAACFAAGLLPYAHLPLAHRLWRGRGSWGDASTPAGFLRHLLRSDYGTFKLISRTDAVAEGPAARTALWLADLATEQSPPGAAALMALGVVVALAAVVRDVRAARAAADGSGGRATSGSSSSGAGEKTPRQQRPPQAAQVTVSRPLPAEPQARAAHADTTHAGAGEGSPPPSLLPPSVRHAAAVARAYPAFLAAALAFYLAVFHGLSNMALSDPLLFGVHARFWMQPNLLAFALGGVGTAWAAEAALGVVVGRVSPMTTATTPTSPSQAATASAGVVAAVVAIGAALVGRQYAAHARALDNSGTFVMHAYGHALLDPLPHGAILVTGWDHQWTATRYLQGCEGVRPDVQLLNSAVMSFHWFAAQRALYPNVTFPGTHLVGHLTAPHAAGGFSLTDFFAANVAADGGAALVRSYDDDPPHPDFTPRQPANLPPSPVAASGSSSSAAAAARNGGVFFTGSALFGDAAYAQQFDLAPHGIVERVMPKYTGERRRLTTWRNLTVVDPAGDRRHRVGRPRPPAGTDAEAAAAQRAWAAATAAFDGRSVDFVRYGPRTWEHAARVDFWAKAASYAAWLLEWALQPAPGASAPAGGGASEEPRDVGAVLAAAAVLEDVVRYQAEAGTTVLASSLKNLGLAYVRLVRSSQALPVPVPAAAVGAADVARTAATEVTCWPSIPGHEALAAGTDESAFRLAASRRVLQVWGEWVTRPEARVDAGFASVQQIVGVLQRAVGQSPALTSDATH